MEELDLIEDAYDRGYVDGEGVALGTYTHRNGETDDPEVDGWYFVEWLGQWTVERNPCQPENEDTFAKFYGPIPMPKAFRYD